jgi:hypothetical protein
MMTNLSVDHRQLARSCLQVLTDRPRAVDEATRLRVVEARREAARENMVKLFEF